MIRFINCIRRQSDISSEQFRQFWDDPKFDTIIDRVVEYTGRAKNLSLMVSANELMQERRRESCFLRKMAAISLLTSSTALEKPSFLSPPVCRLFLPQLLSHLRKP